MGENFLEQIVYEDVGGAFLHGAMLPYFITSDFPRLVKNMKNINFPEEVYEKGNFEEYMENHKGPSIRINARFFGLAASIYGTLGLIHFTDLSYADVGEFLVGTNLIGLAYSQLPEVRNVVHKIRDMGFNLGCAISNCIR
jgi:hypothetical protein